MKILANLGTLSDGRTALVIEDAYKPNYVLANNFDDTAPENNKWSSATYFDGNLKKFCDKILEIETGISHTELAGMMETELEDVEDVREHFEEMGWDPTLAAFFGYEEV